jgi:hypothetical protein
MPPFKNIQVIPLEETGIPGEIHWPVSSHWQTLSELNLYISYHWNEPYTMNNKACLAQLGKELHRKLKIDQYEPTENRGWIHLLRKGKQFFVPLVTHIVIET